MKWIPQIYLRCDTCWPLGGYRGSQAATSIHLCTSIGGGSSSGSELLVERGINACRATASEKRHFPSSIQSAMHLRPVYTEQNRKQKRIISLILFAFASTFVRLNSFFSFKPTHQTRMHSSRMRTTRLLPVSPSMLCSQLEGGRCLPLVRRMRIPTCTWADTPSRRQNDRHM